MTPRLIAVLALGGLALAGCGQQAQLERPVARGAMDQQMQDGQSAAARARADAAANTTDPDAPQSAKEVRAYEGTPVAPPRAAPIPGQSADPFAAPPQGSIPDPYNHPERPGDH